jgi:hypothetical protein
METIGRAARIVGDAENNLKKLLAETASGGNYSLVVQLAGWAHSLSDLLSEITGADPEGSSVAVNAKAPDGTRSDVTEPLPAPQKKRRAGEYPRFFRNGETLVKIGWSKSEKAEYEHKAPLAVLTDLAAAISAAAIRKSNFVMEAIIPLKGSRDGNEIPSYQVYLCLAWLRAQGLVVQHGRQGYSIKPKIDLVSKAKDSFALLPEQRL